MGCDMDFETFRKEREKYVEWMSANGFNEGDSGLNGEFKTLTSFKELFDVFIDVGANNGIFLDKLREEKINPYIFAFEPNPELVETLSDKVERGEVIQRALGGKVSVETFNIYDDDTTSSIFMRSDMMPHFTKHVKNIKVDVDVIDNYAPDICRQSKNGLFIKIDAEGYELPVLKGGENLLATTKKCFIMFEYSKAWKIGGHMLKEAFHFLDNLGFCVFRITPLGLEELRFYTPDMDGSDYCNYFSVKGIALDSVLDKTRIRSFTHNWNNFYRFF